MLLIILNAKDAIRGAINGIELCLYTVIPALFPYCALSIWFRSLVNNNQLKSLGPIEKYLNLPYGGFILLILGLLGGYPIGAICVERAIKSKQYHREHVKYMHGICNNAGPSFIIGIVGISFVKKEYIYLLILIQIFSVLCTCILLSKQTETGSIPQAEETLKFSDAIHQAIIAISNVCATVILFKTVLSVAQNIFYFISNQITITIITSFFEITNGASLLKNIHNENLRFIIAAGMISFGGICVHMQTLTILPFNMYKYYVGSTLIKTFFSIWLSTIFVKTQSIYIFITSAIILLIFIKIIKTIIYKKTVAIKKKIMYNTPIS